jgi:hypothetical protein
MRRVCLAVVAACVVVGSAPMAQAQLDPFTAFLGIFGASVQRYEIVGMARRQSPRCISMVSDGKTYSLAAKRESLPDIPLNKKIRVVGYGITHGPALRCPGAIGMVVLHWQPEP